MGAEGTLGWGVIGAAWIAGRAVIPAIQASRNGRVVAVASREPARAHELASAHSIAKVLPTYEDVLADPEVEAVYIPLVNNLHREWTLRALAAGKHVLCEKPLAMNATEAQEMVGAATSSGLCLMEAFMYRFHPRTRDFVESLRGSDRPLHVHATFGFPLQDAANYRWRKALGGGSLLDVGCYTVNVARWILGEPETVVAEARVDPDAQVDMSASALLGFPGGATASLWCSFESAEAQGLTAVTRNGAFALERPFSAWRDPDDPYQLMVESFVDRVRDGRPVDVPLADSVANMQALDRIREAARI